MESRAFTQAQIIAEIQRCASENGDRPLGRARFEAVTGIKESDWSGRYWVRWNDALAEAGFPPNQMNAGFPDDVLLTAMAKLTRELGHLPTYAELTLHRRTDSSFPSPKTFDRFGTRSEKIVRLREFCEETPGFGPIANLLDKVESPIEDEDSLGGADPGPLLPGVVYLMRSGRHYKVGRSVDGDRRERELRIQLPEKLERVHAIRTDDTIGIERYWHVRFDYCRLNGEWFALSPQDVAAFKRRKNM